VGFLTIKGDSVQLLSFKSPTGTVDRLLDQVPGLVEKLSEMKQKKEGKAEDKAEEPPKE